MIRETKMIVCLVLLVVAALIYHMSVRRHVEFIGGIALLSQIIVTIYFGSERHLNQSVKAVFIVISIALLLLVTYRSYRMEFPVQAHWSVEDIRGLEEIDRKHDVSRSPDAKGSAMPNGVPSLKNEK